MLTGVIAVALAASAIQLMDTKEQIEKAKLQRQWALFEPNTIFTVKKNRDPKLDEYPELTLEGSVGYPVALVSGRWLQYQVRDSPAEEERGFVTLVRYTPECPTGKATALFNWKSGAMEVQTLSIILHPLHSLLRMRCTSRVLNSMQHHKIWPLILKLLSAGDSRRECSPCVALILCYSISRSRLAGQNEPEAHQGNEEVHASE